MQSSPRLCYLGSLKLKYIPQHPIRNVNLQPMFLSQCERDQVSHPYKTTGKNYGSVHCNLYIFGYQVVRQKILDRMVADISSVQSTLNFFMNLYPASFRHTLSV